MRVLIVTDSTSWMRGGVPAETRALINGLTAHGHVVGLASDAPLRGAESARHFSVTIPITSRFREEVGAAIEAFKPDFVHVICMSSKGTIALTPILRPFRWALTVHSLPPYERKLRMWHGNEQLHYFARSLRFALNTLGWQWVFRSVEIPRVIVHSEFVADVVTRYGFPDERVTLIPLAFHPDAPGSSPRADRPAFADGPLLVSVGGLAHTKGQHDLVRALPLLLARWPGLRCQMVGEVRDVYYVRWMNALACELGVDEQLHITPDLTHDAKAALLARADVYVQPSHEEGFCLAFAEAAAVVPRLVGTDAGAMSAMSRGDPGARVVPIRQPGAIARAVLELLDTPLPSEHMATRAARMSLQFSYANYLRAHEALYSA